MDNIINLKNRQQLQLSGVEHIYSFNETKIEIRTSLGDIRIEGEKLDMGNLSIEEGMLNIKGVVNAIIYPKVAKRDEEGFFKKLFK